MDDWQLQPARDHALPPLERARSLAREPGLISSAGHIAWWTCIRAYLRTYHRLEIVNPNLLPPKAPFVMVANHSSHLDALVLAAPLPNRMRDRVFPIAAADVFFQTPAVTMFASLLLNALPMYRANRGRHALADLRARLISEPCGYILFPEGARSRTGEMLPVKAGLGMIIAGTPVPVVPCWLEGCFEAMRPDVKIPRPRKIRVHVGQSVQFPDTPNTRDGWDHIAQEVQSRIQALRPTLPPDPQRS